MDIPREPVKNRRRLRQIGIGVGALVVITLVLSSLKPAASSIESGTPWIDSVRRGEMLREVRGPGTLVPEHIRYITALASTPPSGPNGRRSRDECASVGSQRRSE